MTEEHPSEDKLTLRIFAMPKDANPAGNIFGGWIVSLMDMAGSTIIYRTAKKNVVTVAIDKLTFHKPVFIGDEVSCYSEVVKMGRTSMQIKVETWVRRLKEGISHNVTEGIFTYVAIDEQGKPTPISND